MNKRFLAILLLVGCCFCLGGLTACGSSHTVQEQEQPEQNEDTTAQVEKLDETKNLVYDAPLDYASVSPASYTTPAGVVVRPTDIKLPLINIDSPDAQKANDDLSGYANTLLTDYEDLAAAATWYNKTSYQVFEPGDYLSVLVTQEQGGTDVPSYDYKAYVFDLRDGHQLTLAELYTQAGFTKRTLETAVKTAMDDYLRNEMGLSDDTADLDRSWSQWGKQVDDNVTSAYLDNQGQLYIYAQLDVPEVGAGTFTVMLPVIGP